VVPYHNEKYPPTRPYREEWTQQVEGSDYSLYSAFTSLNVQFRVQITASYYKTVVDKLGTFSSGAPR